MENELTSSIINTLGVGSGINMAQLANDLAEARFASQRTRLEDRNLDLETRIETATLIRNQISQFASALGERVRTGDLSPEPVLGNPAVANASVLTGITATGSYDLEVTQLASGQTLALDPVASGDDLLGSGTLTLRLGTVAGASFTADTEVDPVEITVEDTDTLASLAAKISASDAGLSAYVANGINGAQLVIKGAEGAQSGFTVEGTGGASALAWNPASDSGQLRETAQDAEFMLDTIAMTNSTNSITGLPEGLQLELTATNVGAPTTINFTDRTGQISDVMSDFVTALNDIATQLNEASAPLSGVLGDDPGARLLKRELASLTSEVIMPNAAEDEPSTLSDLGLSLNRDGSFRFDAERLGVTLENNAEAAVAMFTTGLFGVFATIDDLARATASSADPGSLAGSISSYTDEIAENTERLAEIAEQQEVVRARFAASFGAADRQVALNNSTLDFLRAQFSNGSDS
jgi:flagellar hook-associated protein 2